MSEIRNIRPAGPDHQVVTVSKTGGGYRRKPCGGCPWVTANDGNFPAEAFRHSANTAHDMATTCFACHESGADKPAICAGFLLRNAQNNLSVRMAQMRGTLDMGQVHVDGRELHTSYRAMAEANGVPADDAALANCRCDATTEEAA